MTGSPPEAVNWSVLSHSVKQPLRAFAGTGPGGDMPFSPFDMLPYHIGARTLSDHSGARTRSLHIDSVTSYPFTLCGHLERIGSAWFPIHSL